MFWFNGWTVYLMKGVSNMAIKKYIGARYAPKFMGAWDKSSEYAALSVVYANEQSYVSRKTVPANTEITNTEFWIKSADWNAQVTQYNQNVERYEAEVLEYGETLNSLVGKTVYTYNTKDDMAADKSVQLNDTLMTCGYAEVNDKKGSFYKASPTTSSKAIALQNGLFAEPFDLYNKNITLTGAKSIDDLYSAKEDIGTSINKYFADGNTTLFINDTNYTFNVGIIMKNKTQIIQIGKGTLTYTGTGAALTVADYCKVSGITITGNNDNNGIQENGYVSLVENCTILNTNTAIVINSVSIVINKCYISDCKTFGVNFTQKTPGTYTEATCIHFNDCTWKGCAVAVNDEPVDSIPSVVNVEFNMCVFEGNTKALNITSGFCTVLKSCWLENNTNVSTVNATYVTFFNIYKHPDDPGYEAGPYSSGILSTSIDAGNVGSKKFTLWGNDINDKHTLEYNDGLKFDGKKIVNNIAYCQINNVGTIVRKSGFPDDCVITVLGGNTEQKTIKFNGYFGGAVHVTSANGRSENSTVFVTQAVNIRMAGDDATRNDYGAFDTIAVKTYVDGSPAPAFTELTLIYDSFTKQS